MVNTTIKLYEKMLLHGTYKYSQGFAQVPDPAVLTTLLCIRTCPNGVRKGGH